MCGDDFMQRRREIEEKWPNFVTEINKMRRMQELRKWEKRRDLLLWSLWAVLTTGVSVAILMGLLGCASRPTMDRTPTVPVALELAQLDAECSQLFEPTTTTPANRPLPDLSSPPLPPFTHYVDRFGWRRVGGAMQSANFPLIEAVRDAKDFRGPNGQAVIQVDGARGSIPSPGQQQLGGGDAGTKSYKAHWDGDPLYLALVGVNNAEIQEITLYTHDGVVRSGGIRELRIQNLTIRNNWNDRCIGSVANQVHEWAPGEYGLLWLEDVRLVGRRDGSHGGYGVKFGIRSPGGLAYRINGLVCAGAQEHAVYVNTPQPGPDGCSSFTRIWHKGSWRTCCQIVDRPLESDLPVPTAHLWFSDILAVNVNGEGGGGITIAGHWGPITVRRYAYQSGSIHSALAVWHPQASHQGWRAAPDGWLNGDVILHDIVVDCDFANQDALQVDKARSLQVTRRWYVRSPKTAIDLGKIGELCFEWANPPGLSTHPGFAGPGRKITQDVPGEPNRTLTNAEIDALPLCEEINL